MDWNTCSRHCETKAERSRLYNMHLSTTLFQNCLAIALTGFIFASCGGPDNTNRGARTDSADTERRPHAASPESLALVPGESAGAFRLGESDSLAHQQFGQPDYSDAAMGKAVLLWYTGTDSAEYPLSIFISRDMGNDETARIQQIRVTSPTFKTDESLGVGSTLTEISDGYQVAPIETYEKNGETYSIYDSNTGIAFELGPDDRCVAIIIHPADVDVATYLPLRPVDE